MSKDDVFEHTVLYLTSHRRWTFNDKETLHLSLFLGRGGTLWLDDCYPQRGFALLRQSVRPEVAKMSPGSEPVMLTKTDPKVNDTFRMIYSTMPWPGEAEFENRPWQYFLLDGRPAVFFTPNDDGVRLGSVDPAQRLQPDRRRNRPRRGQSRTRNDVPMGGQFPALRVHSLGCGS